LYLAHNGITTIKGGLPIQSKLHTLDLSSNPLTSLESIEGQNKLEELWMTSTMLSTYNDLAPLQRIPFTITCIYLEHSPLAQQSDYREVLTKMFPNLVQLDATSVAR
jgi:protein phosphatase 1 regulatory subunit 7